MRKQLILDVHEEIIVDNFAGGGGASTGIELALARAVDLAINHDPDALAMHRVNHPESHHIVDDVWRVDPLKVTSHRRVGAAWFSPDCKDFSKAKGGKPVSKKIRGLAWVMVKWAATARPRVMFLENVEEFADWGPLLADNTRCPRRRGKTFRSFVARLRALDYEVDWRELRACDYGAPTIRKRLFLIARCDGRPIVWPAPTHGKPGSVGVRNGTLKPWRTAAECIDFSLPCPSIFLTKGEAKQYGVKRPLADATMRRIARGVMKFVITNPRPFIVKVNHTGYNQFRGQSIEEPLQTITSVHPYAIVSPHITKFRTGATGSALDEPLHTITAGPKENPAGAAHAMGVVEATLAPIITEHANATGARSMPADEPMRTQCANVKGGHFAAVTAFLAKHYGGNETPGASLNKPTDTITTKDHHSLVAVNVVRHFGESTGSDAGAPVGSTTAGGGGKTGIVASYLSKQYKTTTGQPIDEPLHTVTSGGNHISEVRAFLVKYYGSGGQDQDLAEPMHTIRAKACLGLVMVEGEEYVITDIGMRMLEPRELFLAQGFPPDYVIDVGLDGKRLPKHAQVRMVGNSVPPPMSEALVAANVPELSLKPKRRRAA